MVRKITLCIVISVGMLLRLLIGGVTIVAIKWRSNAEPRKICELAVKWKKITTSSGLRPSSGLGYTLGVRCVC
jgi:hypothetical protein